MSDEDRPTDDGWRTPRWSNRDFNVLKLRHQDEIAKLDGMISQIGEATRRSKRSISSRAWQDAKRDEILERGSR